MKLMKNNLLILFMTFVLSFVCILSVVCPINVRADSTGNNSADVVKDLQKDSTFSVQDYPIYTYEQIRKINKDGDDSNDVELLNVISIAEGYNKELYLYVYNPTKATLNIIATEISMYCEDVVGLKNKIKPRLYDLDLVSSYSVFDKYVVKDFVVSDETYRFYNIVEISRPFNADIDTSIEDGITDDKAIKVGQKWCAYYYNDELVYEMEKIKVVEIRPVLNDFIYYGDGVTFGNLIGLSSSCRGYYLAFNVENFNVDKIYDADLVYNTVKYTSTTHQDYILGIANGDPTITTTPDDNYTPVEMFLSEKDSVTYKGNGLFTKEYSWNRIMSATAFVENLEKQGGSWNATTKEKLLQSQWVFAFAETKVDSFTTNSYSDGIPSYLLSSTTVESGTAIGEVDILRLHFLSDGKVYNLGVVSDKTTSDNLPGGIGNLDDEEDDWWKKIIYLILIILLVLVLLQTGILPLIGKAVVFVISAPFIFIKWLIDKLKGD